MSLLLVIQTCVFEGSATQPCHIQIRFALRQAFLFCSNFSDFMNSSLIKDPPALRQKFELFTAEQRSLNKKRLDLLESLRFVLQVHDIK